MLVAGLTPLGRKIGLLFSIILSALLLAFPAVAGDTIGGSTDNAASDIVISVHQAEIRATAGAMTATGGYARIENTGHQDVTLVSVDAGFATKSEIHTMIAEDGVMKMRRLEGGVVIPAHGEALLRSGGTHLMFIGLTGAMKPGSLQQIILHFDNGEMSKEEIITRQASALTGVGHHYLETGLWRQMGDETVKKVRDAFEKIRNQEIQLYYYNVGGYTVDKMIATLRRFYYSTVGRGNPMIFSFDYIKTANDSQNGKSEWQVVGEMVDKFKRTIQKEIVKDGEPIIPMITSVQSNRSGVVNNRRAENIVDDESIVSLSDRITQFCSHMFILRKKTLDEVDEEPNFGTHKLINVKARHLGKSYNRATEPVRMPDDSLKQNVVHLSMDAFTATEVGDQLDLANALGAQGELEEHGRQDDPVPAFRAG